MKRLHPQYVMKFREEIESLTIYKIYMFNQFQQAPSADNSSKSLMFALVYYGSFLFRLNVSWLHFMGWLFRFADLDY